MVCPVCTIAVAAGVGVLREFGVDDIITGIWFGALIISSIIWFVDWLNRKKIHFLFRKILVIILFYAIFLWPLYYWGIMGQPNNILFGMDKLLFGVIIGTIAFISSVLLTSYIKEANENQVLFKYQKVIIPLFILTITSIIVDLIIKIAILS